MAKQNAYDKITAQVIEALDKGIIPWEKPWNNRVTSANAPQSIYRKSYRGFNAMWLGFVQMAKGYSDPRWITFNAAKKQGGKVRKGEKSQTITFWSNLYKHDKNPDCNETKAIKQCGNKCGRIVMLRYFNVFNVEQVDGLDLTEIVAPDETAEFDPIEAAEKVVSEYLEREGISLLAGNEAFYTPAFDTITLPARAAFKSAEGYYSTAFHEAGHSTGHTSRLNRKDATAQIKFGDPDYAQEELVAEMTSAFIGGHTGVSNKVEDSQRVAYIQSWLKALKNDSKLVVIAAAQAQKAADLILGK